LSALQYGDLLTQRDNGSRVGVVAEEFHKRHPVRCGSSRDFDLESARFAGRDGLFDARIQQFTVQVHFVGIFRKQRQRTAVAEGTRKRQPA